MDFVQPPVQERWPPPTTPASDQLTLADELRANLMKGSVEEVAPPAPDQPVFYSSQFTVPKGDTGKFRQVSNLRALNRSIQPRPFKMETMGSLKDVLLPGDLLTSLDIQDAFFHVPLDQAQRDFYRFRWEGKHYRFRAMPFGLSVAPRTFTKVLRPVVGYLRSRGIRCLIYLDDMLILSRTWAEAICNTQLALDLLTRLGFSVNIPKSSLEPATRAEYLGFVVDSAEMMLFLPAKKLDKLCARIRATLNKSARHQLFSPRDLAALVGQLHATHPALYLAPLFVRHLRRCYLADSLRSWDQASVLLPLEAQEELRAFLRHINEWNGRSVIHRPPTILLTTDASRTGWGAWLSNPQTPDAPSDSTWGFWAPAEGQRTSNWREATATLLAIQAFAPKLQRQSILVRTDNTSNVSALNRLGSSVPSLAVIAKQTLTFCHAMGTSVSAQHVPGLSNYLADQLSRIAVDSSDWKLNPVLFREITDRWFLPTVDLFATRVNRQVPRFFSFRADPEAAAQDAFAQRWDLEQRPYANPPFNMIGRVLRKIQEEKVHDFILVAPLWRTQSWWPLLGELLCSRPLLLPRCEATFLPGHLGSHRATGPPCWDSIACRLSGQPSTVQAFRLTLGERARRPFDLLQPQHMIAIGANLSPT